MLLLSPFTLKQEVQQQNTSTFCNYNVWKLFLKRCVECEKGLGSPCGMRGKLYAQRCLCQPTLTQLWSFSLLFYPLEQILLRTAWPASSMVGSPSVTTSAPSAFFFDVKLVLYNLSSEMMEVTHD